MPTNEGSTGPSAADAITTVDEPDFNFEQHGRTALADYAQVRERYATFASKIESILKEALNDTQLKAHSVTSRAKSEESFFEKAQRRSEDNPNRPKYPAPLKDMTDLAGARVTVYFPDDVSRVAALVRDQFTPLEETDKFDALVAEKRLGYRSLHFLIQLKEPRVELPEYRSFAGMVCEVQLRTILQHAWAEIEHDVRYKAAVTSSADIERRFLNLAGLFEIADREFQFIHDEDTRLRAKAASDLEAGRLGSVPINGENLRTLLDQKLGRDARVTQWGYNFVARVASAMGMKTLDEVDMVLKSIDPKSLRGKLFDRRPSPPFLFEQMLLAYYREKFIANHPWSSRGSSPEFWANTYRNGLKALYPDDYKTK